MEVWKKQWKEIRSEPSHCLVISFWKMAWTNGSAMMIMIIII